MMGTVMGGGGLLARPCYSRPHPQGAYPPPPPAALAPGFAGQGPSCCSESDDTATCPRGQFP